MSGILFFIFASCHPLMLRIWKYADWQIYLICSATVRFSSRIIPKFRAECADWIFALVIWIWLFWIMECIRGVVNVISSFFSSFNFSLFTVIHDLISATHLKKKIFTTYCQFILRGIYVRGKVELSVSRIKVHIKFMVPCYICNRARRDGKEQWPQDWSLGFSKWRGAGFLLPIFGVEIT